MFREVVKSRTTAKRQKHGKKQIDIEQEPLTLNTRAEALAMSKDHHAQLLTRDESSDIRQGVEELSMEAERLREISRNPHKSRSRQLDIVQEHNPFEEQASSDGEEETGSQLGSLDTQPYSEQLKSSPAVPYKFGTSPMINGQPIPIVCNPEMINNPPPALPNVAATPVDSTALIQAMFSQQAESNRQQAESNRQLQLLLASSIDNQIDQQTKQLQQQTNMFARQNIVDARTSIKPMRDGINICQYLNHVEIELKEAKVPQHKWKAILISKLFPKGRKSMCSPYT